jgi:hypothetical protein
MSDLDPNSDSQAQDARKAKRERILAVSRTVHQVPVEEGGMWRRPVAAPALVLPPEGFWRRVSLAAGGAVAGLAAGLWIGRKALTRR